MVMQRLVKVIKNNQFLDIFQRRANRIFLWMDMGYEKVKSKIIVIFWHEKIND